MFTRRAVCPAPLTTQFYSVGPNNPSTAQNLRCFLVVGRVLSNTQNSTGTPKVSHIQQRALTHNSSLINPVTQKGPTSFYGQNKPAGISAGCSWFTILVTWWLPPLKTTFKYTGCTGRVLKAGVGWTSPIRFPPFQYRVGDDTFWFLDFFLRWFAIIIPPGSSLFFLDSRPHNLERRRSSSTNHESRPWTQWQQPYWVERYYLIVCLQSQWTLSKVSGVAWKIPTFRF